MPSDDIAAELRRGLRWLGAATGVLYGVVVLLVVVFWHDSTSKTRALLREATRTTSALCALRGDLQTRINTSERFLADHPQGIPGISAASIRSSINGQRHTIAALSPLNCPPE